MILVGKTKYEIVLRMFFLKFSSVDMLFDNKTLI